MVPRREVINQIRINVLQTVDDRILMATMIQDWSNDQVVNTRKENFHGHYTEHARIMTRALAKTCLTPDRVDYINAHATGTPVGDPIEVHAIKRALGDHAAKVAVSSTKSVTGHLLGAAGALAISLTALALHHGLLPPTVNLSDPDPECDLFHVTNAVRETDARVALVPSYGFGGHNSCAVVARWNE